MIDHIMHVARPHALIAYLLAFVLTGPEAFPIIDAHVPGTAVILGLGALMPAGVVRFWPLVTPRRSPTPAPSIPALPSYAASADSVRLWGVTITPSAANTGPTGRIN